VDDVTHRIVQYLANAEDCRREAESVYDEELQQQFLQIADQWEKMAIGLKARHGF